MAHIGGSKRWLETGAGHSDPSSVGTFTRNWRSFPWDASRIGPSTSHMFDTSRRGYGSRGNPLFLPGATVATLMMLGALHIRRMYDEKQSEDLRRQGKEIEFVADWKATILQMLPLRLISRTWGSITSVELPVWIRPYVYKGWARAFHADLSEAGQAIEEYKSLKDFFTRKLKQGARPIDETPACLLSPVDGIVLRCGQVRGSGTMIEQVKGFSYSISSLLGADSTAMVARFSETIRTLQNSDPKEINISSDKKPEQKTVQPALLGQLMPASKPAELDVKGLFYCVLYLGPGDYHRIHAPSDWNVYHRRHIYGRLFPVNERAVRSIKNLYAVNERVVLEGKWSQGLMAMVAVGATNVGSIELKFEPDLRTNVRKKLRSSSVSSRTYGENGNGLFVNAGEEVAIFNLGSSVVLLFEAPASMNYEEESPNSVSVTNSNDVNTFRRFAFSVGKGDRVRMGQSIGQW